MRVMIIDDHEVLWAGMRIVVEKLAAELRRGDVFEWKGARNIEGARALADRPFDLILLDYHLREIEGVAALKATRAIFEEPPIVMISGDESPEAIRSVIEEGAAGYIPKTMSEQQMLRALSLVLAHGVYLPPTALLDVHMPTRNSYSTQTSDPALETFITKELTARQREVFARALRGMPNKIISRDLGIAEGTVKVHLAMVFRAMGVRNRTEAMYRVLSSGATSALGRL